MTRIPEITTEELRTAINETQKKGKSTDRNGIRAEDIKACDDETREMVRQIFIEIIKRNKFTPEAWKKVKIKVIQKKGDVENVGNYARSAHCLRCTNCSRQYCTADYIHDSTKNKRKIRQDSGSSYQTTDHLATYRMIEQKCFEWGITRWTADFTKAFDSITHKSIWKALESCGIDQDYISLLEEDLQRPESICSD